jgi:MATE family multidrug resistance protein
MQLNYIKKTAGVAWPIILSQLIGSITGFTGMALLAALGHTVLSASALLYSIQTMIFIIGISPLFALSVLISRANGKGNKAEIGNILQQSWMLALLLALIIFGVYSEISPLLQAFKQSPTLISVIEPFFDIARWGVPATILSVSCSQFFYGVGKQKLVAVITVAQAGLLILSGYSLVLGHFGFAQHGVAGWGVAYLVTSWSMLFVVITILFFKHEFKQYRVFHVHMSNGWQHLKDLFRFGWPITVQTGGELLSFGFMTIMVGWLGGTSLAAIQIVTQFLMIMVVPAFGFSMAAGILVGHSMGAKHYEQAKMFGTTNLILCVSIIGLLGLMLNIFSQNLAHIFLEPGEAGYQQILHLVKIMFVIVACTQIFDSARNCLTGALRGLLDMRIPMVVGLVTIWLLNVPCAYLLAFKLHFGVVGISLGSVAGTLIAAAVLFLRWRYKIGKLGRASPSMT